MAGLRGGSDAECYVDYRRLTGLHEAAMLRKRIGKPSPFLVVVGDPIELGWLA